ncbi:MAG: DNA repair protein RecO [Rickettsiaceae bacterium H1]|nr:DNA repair protein RecO [Rickettsiaceae bacterium H1]
MKLTDVAILLTVEKRDEKSAIISVLTKNHGLYSGYVVTKNFCALQIGNVLNVRWSARLSIHLGRFYFELLESIPALFFHDYKKMLALCAVAKTLAKILPERDPKFAIYESCYSLLHALKNSNKWLINYVKLELTLLKELGFGLDLNKCPVNNSVHDLAFISPKTGRAISYNVGLSYKDKLLHLPKTLYEISNNRENTVDPENEFTECLQVTNYFLYKHCFNDINISIPVERELLYKAFASN